MVKTVNYFIAIVIGLMMPIWVNGQTLEVTELRCEYKKNPIGIDAIVPRLSWQLRIDRKNVIQTGYSIRVAKKQEDVQQGTNLLWNTKKVIANESVHIKYKGQPLSARQRYYWQVKVWDNYGNESEWSEPAFWEMGLLSSSDWKGEWIGPSWQEDSKVSNPVTLVRKSFSLKSGIQSARLYITARGIYEAEINGKRVGDQVFTPGWTAYKKRLQYQIYDVTAMLREGKNAIGARIGDGWYRGFMGFDGGKNYYGDEVGLLAQLEVKYADGTTKRLVTDGTWEASTGAILKSDIYNGETYDARKAQKGWSTADFSSSGWEGVKTTRQDGIALVAPEGPPIRRIQEITPVAILKTPKGEQVVDMGQNMVGVVRLKVKGDAGHKVTLLHAEVLDKDGNFYTENLRAAQQKVEYILKGAGEEVYEPYFTFQGFRYVKVLNYPGTLTKESITGVVIHSDMSPTGTFECSHPLLNQLQHNILWGQKGNFLDVPTDCPQRDERMGWTGDAQVFARTAAYNMNVATFYAKWLKDLAADQLEDGSVPFVIPNVLGDKSVNATGWSDAATIIPWAVYEAYGDKQILEEQYPSMKSWVSLIESKANNYLWDKGFHFGDWLYYSEPSSLTVKPAHTDVDLLATAFFAHSTKIMEKTATVLGKLKDAERYAAQFRKIQQAFQDEYLTKNGRLTSHSQTAYVIAIAFDLLPPSLKKNALERLVDIIRMRKNHISTGFLGTPHICFVLSENGYLDVAYELLLQETYPSWLYPVKKGATTIWERWDGIRPDGRFQSADMNSFNHYAYGAIGDWMYRTIAGINSDPQYPGYRHIIINPRPKLPINAAKASLKTLYGKIGTNWNIKNNQFALEVEIPTNTIASVHLPNIDVATVKSMVEVLEAEQNGKVVVAKVGSGKYQFNYTMKDAKAIAAVSGQSYLYNLNTTLGALWKNEETRAVLLKHLPQLASMPKTQLEQGFSMPLQDIASILPDIFTKEKMALIKQDLKGVK